MTSWVSWSWMTSLALSCHSGGRVGSSRQSSQGLNTPLLNSVRLPPLRVPLAAAMRSEEHTSELQSLMRISYAVFCLKKKKPQQTSTHRITHLTTMSTHEH